MCFSFRVSERACSAQGQNGTQVSSHQLAFFPHPWLCLVGKGTIHRHVNISDRLSSHLIKQLSFGLGGTHAVVQLALRRTDSGRLPVVGFGNSSTSVS